jgi:hypothetical protein
MTAFALGLLAVAGFVVVLIVAGGNRRPTPTPTSTPSNDPAASLVEKRRQASYEAELEAARRYLDAYPGQPDPKA